MSYQLTTIHLSYRQRVVVPLSPNPFPACRERHHSRMKILTEEEMQTRLEYARPLKPSGEVPSRRWCIPFEYGANEKGTRISIPEAKRIAAELRAEIAEAEKCELFEAFKKEEERSKNLGRLYSETETKWFEVQHEIAELKRKLRAKRKK